MFGIDNTGVINQKNAPAIWESDFADFPANTIKGRFLLALDTITLYVDLVTSNNPSNRAIVASGLIGDGSGTNVNFTGNGDYTVDLGGDLLAGTVIDLNGHNFEFQGATTTTKIQSDGAMLDTATTKMYFPTEEQNIAVIVADKLLVFSDPINGDTYKVLCQKN